MLEKSEVNDKRCGQDQSMTASKTLNDKRSYNVCRAPEGVVLIFSASPSTIHYERMGAQL